MKKIIFIIAICITNSLNGQINAYLNVGAESNSGALVYPYNNPSPLIAFPRQISCEIEYKLTNKFGIACLVEKKINAKEQFLGSDLKSKIYYWGIKNNITLFDLKKPFSIELSPYIAYGKETDKWEKYSFNLFSSNNHDVNGQDKFDLLRAGLHISLILTYNRFVFRGSLIYNYDFVVDGTREVYNSDAVEYYERFAYEGILSRGIQLSIGIRLFGNDTLQNKHCKESSK